MTQDKYVPRWPPFTFCGVRNTPLQEAKAVIVPVPFDSTQSYRPGARYGPESIIDASRFMELFDHELECSPVDVGIHTMSGVEPVRGNARKTIDRVSTVLSELFRKGKLPIVLGGEHTVSVPVTFSAKEVHEDLGVLCLDAHSDLRDSYEGSSFSHACTVRRMWEATPNLTVVGVRSCSREEWDLIRENDLMVHFWKEGQPRRPNLKSMDGALESVLSEPERPLHLSIDLDVFNPADLPAVGTPEPSGPHYDDLLPRIRRIVQECNLVAVDMVELNPIQGDNRSQFLAARLIYKILGYLFRSREEI